MNVGIQIFESFLSVLCVDLALELFLVTAGKLLRELLQRKAAEITCSF